MLCFLWRDWVRGYPQGQAQEEVSVCRGPGGGEIGTGGRYHLLRTMTSGGSFIPIFGQMRAKIRKIKLFA